LEGYRCGGHVSIAPDEGRDVDKVEMPHICIHTYIDIYLYKYTQIQKGYLYGGHVSIAPDEGRDVDKVEMP